MSIGPNLQQGLQVKVIETCRRQRELAVIRRHRAGGNHRGRYSGPNSSPIPSNHRYDKRTNASSPRGSIDANIFAASVTFLPQLDGNCTFNVLVYADADSDVPMEWGDSDAKEIKNGEKVQLRSFSTNNHRVDTIVSYRYAHHDLRLQFFFF